MRKRSVTAVLLATAVAVPALAAPALASAPVSAPRRTVEIEAPHWWKHPDDVIRPGKRVQVKVVHAHGRVAAVDTAAKTLTLTVRGDHTFTGTVGDATVIRLDGKKATLADLTEGDRVVAKAWRSGTSITFTRLTARSPHPSEDE